MWVIKYDPPFAQNVDGRGLTLSEINCVIGGQAEGYSKVLYCFRTEPIVWLLGICSLSM